MTNNPSSENHEPESGGSSSAPRFGQNDPQESTGGSTPWRGSENREQPQYGTYGDDGSPSGRNQPSYGQYGESGQAQPQYGQQSQPGYGQQGGYQPIQDNGYGQQAGGSYYGQQGENGYYNQPQYQSGNYAQPNYQQYPARAGDRPNGWGMGLAALICGIASVVLCWLVLPGLAGIVAIVLGIVAIRKLAKTPGAGKAMPIIGIVLGGIGVILSVLLGVIFAIGFSVANEAAEHCGGYSAANSAGFEECVNSYMESDY